MMSDLDRAVSRARRQIEQDETPIRRRLRAAYRESLDALQADLDAVTQMIGEARRAGVDVSPDWLRRQSRYRQLMFDAEVQYQRFVEAGARIIHQGQQAAVSGGAHAAPELIEAAGVPVSTVTSFTARVNVPAVERLVGAMQPGSPVRTVLDAYGPFASKVIEDELVAGIIEGKGPREIVRTIRRGVNSGTNRARLDALVRTESMRAFNGSLDEQFQRMAHVIDGYRWSAAKSARTCLACLSMDGRIFTTYQHQQHISCRCICTPYSKSADVPYEAGRDWFARQPAETQRLMMPSQDAYDAYERGDVTLNDFRGVKRSRVWGASIYQRSGREALA